MKFKKSISRLLFYSCVVFTIAFLVIIFVSERRVARKYSDRIYSNGEISEEVISNYLSNDEHRVALILGAGIINNEEPTAALADRVSVGAELYFEGVVDKLLMSGDNRFEDYNEPEVMRNYAVDLGVEFDDIVLDYAGRRTYDSCYRAKYIFGLDELVIVTQDFHLPRALYVCNEIGINSMGFSSNLREYIGYNNLLLRERGARVIAFFDVWRKQPAEVMGDVEIINYKL